MFDSIQKPSRIKESPKQSKTPEEKLKEFKLTIKNPKRNRPDFTSSHANKELARLCGKHQYNLKHYSEANIVINDYYKLNAENRKKLNQFITKSEHTFGVQIKNIQLQSDGLYWISIEIDNLQIPNKQNDFYFQSIVLEHNKTAETIEILNLYPANVVIRGYSIGSYIIKAITRVARLFKVGEISVFEPSKDVLEFYIKNGFINVDMNGQNKFIKYI